MKQKDKYTTACGGLSSVIMIFLLSFIFINRLISIITKSEYTVKVQTIQSANPNYSAMNLDNFMLAIKLEDPLKEYYKNSSKSFFSISLHQYIQQISADGSKNREQLREFKLEQCTVEHFQNIDFQNNAYIEKQLQYYLCLPLTYELQLQGGYNTETLLYPKLLIQLCKDDDNCYSQEEIEKAQLDKNTAITLSTLIKSTLFSSNSTDDDLHQYINSDFYLQSNLQQSIYTDLFFQHNKVQIDDNLLSLMTTTKELDYWSYTLNDNRQFNRQDSNLTNLFEINLRINQQNQITSKTAYRLDQFISYLGGMLKFFTAIFGVFAIKYNLVSMRISLANILYDFNIPYQNQGRLQFSYDRLLNFIQYKINRVDELLVKLKNYTFQVVKLSHITRMWSSVSQSQKLQRQEQSQEQAEVTEQKITQFDINQFTKKLMEYKESFMDNLVQKILDTRNQLRLDLNFYVYILLGCSCFKKIWMTRQLIIQCDQMIKRDLDIITILSKIQQIDKLKKTLLDENQVSVFNYTPRPVIFIDKHYQIITEDQSRPNHLITQTNKQKRARVINKRIRFNTTKKFFKIYNSYLKLKENNNQINYRLTQMLGPTLELIFQKYHEIQIAAQIKEDLNKTQLDMQSKISEQSVGNNDHNNNNNNNNNHHNNNQRVDSKIQIHQYIKPKMLEDDGEEILYSG
ncbi:unnamed protein product (macronuclear) [Paramecium tetraurelia]|uniref:Transmembrane protein n=1 Tax=Paramecium tetraurelia TaxID=5888 RepID=A0C4Z6_PARTE|nr:uncharacterized protein GSPATT00006362001 [Paramecium tetraurelia]CAK65863.1 unnamed protein product [Paramecium tetraurelia]|eukprot:XP_001433260.1 hypothetical protein (macronuclear) [Paramecium tetraurelia strain d4-2]